MIGEMYSIMIRDCDWARSHERATEIPIIGKTFTLKEGEPWESSQNGVVRVFILPENLGGGRGGTRISNKFECEIVTKIPFTDEEYNDLWV